MSTIRLHASHSPWVEAPVVPVQHNGRRVQRPSTDLLDALLRRTNRLLTDSAAAVGRLRMHTEETERQVEASRAFLADSYHTLDVIRRDRNPAR